MGIKEHTNGLVFIDISKDEFKHMPDWMDGHLLLAKVYNDDETFAGYETIEAEALKWLAENLTPEQLEQSGHHPSHIAGIKSQGHIQGKKPTWLKV